MKIHEIKIGSLVSLNDKDYHALEEDGHLNDENNIWKIKRIDEDGEVSIYNEIENLSEYSHIEDLKPLRFNENLLRYFNLTFFLFNIIHTLLNLQDWSDENL